MKSIKQLQNRLPQQFTGAIIFVVNGKINPSAFDLQSPPPSQFLTQREAAQLLHVHIRTSVRKWTRAGKIYAYRYGPRVFHKSHELTKSLISL